MSPTCLVRGSVNIDEFYAVPHIVRPGETLASSGFTRRAGGKGANQAYAVACAGGRVVLEGFIGADGRGVRDTLAGAGVQVDRLEVVKDEVTGRAIIQSSADGENSIILHAGANFHVAPTPSPPALDGMTHLLVQNEVPLAETVRYLAAAHATGLTSVLNPSPMFADPRAFPWALLGWLVVNEGELADVLAALSDARDPADPPAPAPASTAASEGAGVLAQARADILALRASPHFSATCGIITTLGAAGVLVLSADAAEPTYYPAAELEHALVDTTGAGDCFAGYFVAGLLRGDKEPDAVRTALAACSICVERSGAMESIPALEEVAARLRR
ncbi:putative ribokinase [Cryptotrichosporon argae]